MRAIITAALAYLFLGGFVALDRQPPMTWPLTGGLDTKRSPLALQPGSHLRLDNVIQERVNEWRRRNGFTQDSADSLGVSRIGLVARVGDGGVVSQHFQGVDYYQPNLAAARWTSSTLNRPAVSWSRKAISWSAARPLVAMATAGKFILAAIVSTTERKLYVLDTGGAVLTATTLGATVLRVRAAAINGFSTKKAVLYTADSSGNIAAWVLDGTTGVLTAAATLKTTGHTTVPHLDAFCYDDTGATITVVYRTSGNQIRFLEHNPSTGALATDAAIAVNADNCLALMPDASASGVRFVGVSNAVPSTRVLRVNSAGTVSTDDQAEAIAATQITGIGTTAGAAWQVLYQTTGGIRANDKTGGTVNASRDLLIAATSIPDVTLDSQAWFTFGGAFHVLIGLHSSVASDPQDTYLELVVSVAGSTRSITVVSRIMVLQAAPSHVTASSLYQAQTLDTYTARVGLVHQGRFASDAGAISRSFVLDAYTQQTVDAISDTFGQASPPNIGAPLSMSSTAFFPGGQTGYIDISESNSASPSPSVVSLGAAGVPRKLTLTAGTGGALTSSTQVQYVAVIEEIDSAGNLWRSEPSEPAAVTLSSSQNRVTVVWSNWAIDRDRKTFRVVFYRTAGNGSVFRRLTTSDVATSTTASVSITDDASDAALDAGEPVYTTGEVANEPTPPAAHLALFDDRQWIVNRDFPTELWPSKRLRPGRLPEYSSDFVEDIDDDKGDITGIAPMDDKLVVFKTAAVYFVTGPGFEDDGSGGGYSVTRVDSDVGAIAGSPLVATGAEVYFVSTRGLYIVTRDGQVEWIGRPVDQYLHQPLVQTPETIYDGCFVPPRNEIRFVTSNYILVYDRTMGTWTRWTGLAGMKRCLVLNGRMVLFKSSDGTMWREGDHTQLTDAGTAFDGTIRSASLRPANEQGFMRLYRARAVGQRTTGGSTITPTLTVFYDDDETIFEAFNKAIAGTLHTVVAEARPRRQKCRAFSLQLTLPSSDVTMRLAAWAVEVGVKRGAQKRPRDDRWGPA